MHGNSPSPRKKTSEAPSHIRTILRELQQTPTISNHLQTILQAHQTRTTRILSHDLVHGLLLNRAQLLLISADTPIVICELGALHVLQKLLVVGNNDELEILLLAPNLDDVVE